MKRIAFAVLIVVAGLFGQRALPASAAFCDILLHPSCPPPSGVRAVVRGGQISVNWSYPGGDAAGFHIYLSSSDTNPAYADLATYCSFGDVVSCAWPDPQTIQPGQTYFYKVCAIYSGFNVLGEEDDYDSCAFPPVSGSIPRPASPSTGGTSGSSSPIVPASITLSASSVKVGTTLTVSGQHFSKDGTVKLTLASQGVPIVDLGTATVSDGAFSTTLTFPTAIAAGSYQVHAQDPSEQADANLQVISGASITLSASSVTVGNPLTVNGQGFHIAGSSGVKLTLASQGVPIVDLGTATVSDGAFSTTLTFPTAVAAGSYQVHAQDPSEQADANLQVVSGASITLSASSVTVGNTLTVNGQGFHIAGSSGVKLTLASQGVTIVDLGTATVSEGAFSTTLTIPTSTGPAGYQVHAQDSGEQADANLLVFAAGGQATLMITDPSGFTYTGVNFDHAFTLNGANFTAGTMTIFIDSPTGPQLGTATVAADGTFKQNVTIATGQTSSGKHTLVAVQNGTAQASLPVTVEKLQSGH